MNHWTIDHKEMLKEWDSNNKLESHLTRITHIVNWRCSNGHRWSSRPYERIRRGLKCPFCQHQRPSKDYNLAVCYPHLIKEWDIEKNEGLRPEDVLPGSAKKFWWKCRKDHSWSAVVLNRARGDSGCPYCDGLMATPENNLTLLTDLMRQFDTEKNAGIDPKRITCSSMKKLWWKCVNGHEWRASVNSREKGTGCPHCHHKFSRREIRLWSEMEALWGDIGWSVKIDGIEIDVYIPRWKIGVEIDGFHWHENRTEQDKIKSEKLGKCGIYLIRAREKPLRLMSDEDVGYSESEPEVVVIHRIIRAIANKAGENIREYLDCEKFIADSV